MSNSTNRFFLEKLGDTQASDFIGDVGEMFFDPITGVLRVSDGSTPGGIILGALGSTGYVGSFYDTTIQTNLTVVNKISYDSVDISDGVQVVDTTKIKLLHTGNFNIQFSAQIEKTDSGTDSVDIWLMKNGQNVDYSSGRVEIVGNNAKTIAAWNWVVAGLVNDYYEIAWYSADPNVRIYAEPTQTNPSRPGIPSIIVTVTQV